MGALGVWGGFENLRRWKGIALALRVHRTGHRIMAVFSANVPGSFLYQIGFAAVGVNKYSSSPFTLQSLAVHLFRPESPCVSLFKS